MSEKQDKKKKKDKQLNPCQLSQTHLRNNHLSTYDSLGMYNLKGKNSVSH